MNTETQDEVVAPSDRQNRVVTVPIAPASIREYFEDKRVFFLANYSQSRLKGHFFTTYLANLNMPSDVVFDEPLTQMDYMEAMEAYMKQTVVGRARTLHLMMAQILLLIKGVPYEAIPYRTKVPVEYILAFAEKHADELYKWIHFIDSSPVFALSAIASFEREYKPKENYEIIDDKQYVGHNVVAMYEIPHFTELYFGLENATYRLSYFPNQYEEYMFSNQRFADYFSVDNNFLQAIFEGMAQGQIDPSNVEQFLGIARKDDGSNSSADAHQNG